MMNSSQLLISSSVGAAAASGPAINQSQWSSHLTAPSSQSTLGTVLACVLSFLAAAVSSAGGVGGGSLYFPILSVVAGLGLKTAAAFSTFMVTGGTLSNVLYTLLLRGGRRPLIDYGIAVVSQPCVLLGAIAGVICNVMFPEWLVISLFSLFLSFATFKTYRTGVRRWRAETAELGRVPDAAGAEVAAAAEEPLLGRNGGGGGGDGGRRCQWVDLLVLVTVWLCFFAMHLFIGSDGAKGAFNLKPCGIAYRLITVAQVPVAVAFTACIGHRRRKSQAHHGVHQAMSASSKLDALPAYVFPVATLLIGVMSGLFGIGGGLLLNPVLLQIGVPPKAASATTMFMVLFCASMSMAQFIILGVEGIASALVYAATCFAASVVGLAAIERAVGRSGRASLIVFVVAGILALSAAVILCSGAVRVWEEYTSGQYMGFKMPC
ncbi:hypothetical protein C2845_PM03G26590 [Panicum miliaceum]|uniref:Sulfite exporter TauE/SafE family protein 5-like n=1 Tax=Panicum miliaceum TaxID=4540 RepID=A0A3L6T8H3_PANMI|nr:hypothetical protein C2845_PM03G26590 [Panicum miliaceum]